MCTKIIKRLKNLFRFKLLNIQIIIKSLYDYIRNLKDWVNTNEYEMVF